MNTKFKICLIVLFTSLCGLNSCKQYYDPPLVFEPDPGQNLSRDRKVLLISIDGLAGLELKKYTPANMTKMLANAKYTYEGIADANTHDAASWTTLLSGKGSSKHGVTGNSFIAGEDGDDDDIHGHEGNGTSTGYISVYQRLLETGRSLKTLSVSSWNELDQYLFNLSDENGVVASDEAVKTKAVDRIKNGEDNLAFSVINFRDVNEAGKSGGFSLNNAAYKAALDQIDGYIGEILKAVSERKRNTKEDWLIIVTSNHGGIDRSYGGATFEERKVPLIFYNANFVKQEFVVESLGQFVQLGGPWGTPIRALVPADKATVFNFGTTGEYTVQLKINLKDRGGVWPGFFGKKGTTENTGSNPGWAFMFHDPVGGPNWRPIVGHQSAAPVSQLGSTPVKLQEWTTITMKIFEKDGKRYAKNFTNGSTPATAMEITGRNLQNNEPLILGGMKSWQSGNTANFDVSDIRIYKAALPDDYIVNTFCKGETKAGDEYYDKLIAYWPIREGSGDLLKDVVGGADFVFERSPLWSILPANFCNVQVEDKATNTQILLNAVDILPQVFYWLNVKTADSWGLEGKVFLDAYEKEFIGK